MKIKTILDLLNYVETEEKAYELIHYISSLEEQLQQKENIIKEAREKIKSRYEEDKKIFRGSYEWKFILDFEEKVLEILEENEE